MEMLKKIKFYEGQWFAVPLKNGEYAIGIITRGSCKSVCLGYFFGPRFEVIPSDATTWKKNPEEAVLITQFGALGIVNGRWPLIRSTRPFRKEEWPIPYFGMKIPGSEEKGFKREYKVDDSGHWILIRETVVDASEIRDIPSDSMMGGGVVEVLLTKLLTDN